MRLPGLHLLLTYQCNLECDHCFLWGSPWQSGTMTMGNIREILRQAGALGTIEWIYFEGGEPFLYHPVLVRGVVEAVRAGFQVGIVTNGYWATDTDDAVEWLEPLAGLVGDLSISSDLHHRSKRSDQQARTAAQIAERLGIPMGVIRVAQPDGGEAEEAAEGGPPAESVLMYRGRAVKELASRAPRPQAWASLQECPHEDLRDPGRVHVDAFGHVHTCQGISMGNLFRTPLRELCQTYQPDSHPITGPLLRGGPAELVRCYEVPCRERYADACHLCYETRLALRGKFPEILTPDQMYGIPDP